MIQTLVKVEPAESRELEVRIFKLSGRIMYGENYIPMEQQKNARGLKFPLPPPPLMIFGTASEIN